jgi:hypothetical protein
LVSLLRDGLIDIRADESIDQLYDLDPETSLPSSVSDEWEMLLFDKHAEAIVKHFGLSQQSLVDLRRAREQTLAMLQAK